MSDTHDAASGSRLLRVKDLMVMLGLSRTAIYDGMKAGRIPKPIYPMPGAPRWPAEEIHAFLARLRAERAA